MKKLKYILLGGLLLMTLPQAFANIGDTSDFTQIASTGHTKEDYNDCYHCSVLSPW